MYGHGLCMSMAYVWAWLMYGHGLCMGMAYVWAWLMYGHGLCMGMAYVWAWLMYEHGLCMDIFRFCWCSYCNVNIAIGEWITSTCHYTQRNGDFYKTSTK